MLNELITYGTSLIEQLSGGNQMIASAVAGALTLSVSGGVMFMLRTVPNRIIRFVKSQCVTVLTFNNTSWESRNVFHRISTFLMSKTTEAGTRSLSVSSVWDDELNRRIITMSVGFGNHIVWYGHTPLLINKMALESSGGDLLKEQISIYKFGRSHKLFHQLVADNTVLPNDDKLALYDFNLDRGWDISTHIDAQGLDSLALDADIKKMFRDEMDFFLNNREDYLRIGLPWKVAMVLHGIPGSGKTSIIRALAAEYKLRLCILPIHQMSDSSFSKALMSAPQKSIIAIEDFDSARATNARSNVTKTAKSSNNTPSDPNGDVVAETTATKGKDEAKEAIAEWAEGLTLSTILNALDGIASLDGIVIMMTTNCIEKIDDAILRSGRVDRLIELPMVSSEAVKEHFLHSYPALETMMVQYPELTACQINQIKIKAKMDAYVAACELNDVWTKQAANNIVPIASGE